MILYYIFNIIYYIYIIIYIIHMEMGRSSIWKSLELSCFVTRVLALSTRVLSTHSNAYFPVCILVDMFILI